GELHGFVLPPDPVEVQQGGERPLGGMGEPHPAGRRPRRVPARDAGSPVGHSPAARRVAGAVPRSADASRAVPSSTMAAFNSSTTPDMGTMLNTPWPPARRSTTSPLDRASTE